MSDLKQRQRRFWVGVWNEGNLALIDEHIADDFVDHDPALLFEVRGKAGVRQLVTFYRGAFPDLRMHIDELLQDGDRVVMRWTATGTQTGAMGPIPATGRSVKITGTNVIRFDGTREAESWANWDTLGMLQQLGIVPKLG